METFVQKAQYSDAAVEKRAEIETRIDQKEQDPCTCSQVLSMKEMMSLTLEMSPTKVWKRRFFEELDKMLRMRKREDTYNTQWADISDKRK
jgi:hypothetical protein